MHMNYHRAIELAVKNAPLVDDLVESTNDLSGYTGKDDDYVVHLNPNGWHDYPNAVSVDAEAPSGLRSLYVAYIDITGTQLSREVIDYAERHEGQHLVAAKHLGCTAARFGVRVHKVRQGAGSETMTIQPYIAIQDLKTTKLGAALISAYPLPPSKGDDIDVSNYGYSGVDELAEIAMLRNGSRKDPTTEQFYPVPLSSGSRAGGPVSSHCWR